jgi:hypothetical protein
VLSLKGGALAGGGGGGQQYRFGLTVTDSYGQSTAQVTVLVNAPPVNGSVAAAPHQGYGLVTLFTVTAAGWVDAESHYPLRYTFWASPGMLALQGPDPSNTFRVGPRLIRSALPSVMPH